MNHQPRPSTVKRQTSTRNYDTMKMGFWGTLKKPISILAPLSGVTDTVFRQIIARYGKPDVLFTEFVSCDGLCSQGREKLLPDLWYCEVERPIVAQIFGSRPDTFYRSACMVAELGFDGIDINTGCPDKSVEKQGAGAALIKNPELLCEIVRETKRGAGDLPVSVKTRLGYDSNVIEDWVGQILQSEPAVISIHARTRNEMSKVPANWESLTKAVNIRDREQSSCLIVGNGDVTSLESAHQLARQSGVDGVMIGRGIFGNPWFFNARTMLRDQSTDARLKVLAEHARLFDETYRGCRNFAIMRKFFKSYVAGMPEAKTLRMSLMTANDANQVEEIVEQYLSRLEPTDNSL